MINCVIVGLGRIGVFLEKDPYREKPASHKGVIDDNPQTSLVAGIDIDSKKRKQFSQLFKTPSYLNLKGAFENHQIDILHIATPTTTHLSILKEAIGYNIPVVVLEKPIANYYFEAKKILPLLRKCSTRVIINHERRFSKDYNYLKKIIDNRKYGKLLSINSFLFTGNPSNKISLLHDGTHLLDILFYLIDAPNSNEVDNLQLLKSIPNNSMRMSFQIDKIPVYLELDGRKKFFHFEIILYFENGKVEIGNGIFNEYKAKNSKFYKGFRSLDRMEKTFSKTNYFKNMFKHAVELYHFPKRKNISSFENGMAILKLISKLSKK